MGSTAKERIFRYELLDSALECYKRFDVLEKVGGLATCQRYIPLKKLVFEVMPDGQIALNGKASCHSKSSCPVCSLGEQVKNLQEIQTAIMNARKRGLHVYLVTYTFSHGIADELPVIQYLFGLAKQYMYRDGSFRRLLSSIGYHGRITDYEIQLCGKNGYHPHTHDLEFLEDEINEEWLKEVYADYWISSLEKVGLKARKEISVDVLGYKGVGDYVTKLSGELTLHMWSKKSFGRNSMSPFECLCAWHMENENERKMFYGSWWVDYVTNVKGKRMLGWSRGLKKDLLMQDFLDGNEQKGFPLIEIDEHNNYGALTPARWKILQETVNGGNLQDVLECLEKVNITYHVNKIGLKMYEDRLS